MGFKDPRLDAYIETASLFAQPLLKHIRELVHRACPEVGETMRWQFPHFDYKGMLCSMAAFQKHCAFTFWKGSILEDSHNILDRARVNSMGQLGRLTDVHELPPDEIFIAYIQEAMRLNDDGIKLPKKESKK